MNFTSFTKLFFATVLLVSLNACTYKKKLIYFNSTGQLTSSDANKNYTPIFKSDDLLSIIVLGLNEDAVKPFNLPPVQVSFNNGYTVGSQPPPGYLIDANGNIEFPVIGKIKLAGLTRMTAVDTIIKKLKPYLNSPTVLMRILNYKITVLGEVRNPGTFTIPNERITLIEALGLAGDLNITGVRKNVVVIRDENGKKTEYRIDLTVKDLFASPVYYLNQNDVVYVEPNRAKINSSVINAANAGIVISSISLIITVLALLTR
jgi:polysaccharide export outer membrane protein